MAQNYLDRLAAQLAATGIGAPLFMMLSNGGLTHIDEAKRVPVQLLESGPAAGALAGAFNCGINELPLSLIVSWFEQKAIAVLLTLLALGVRNIRLGPTLPAFLTPALIGVLVERFGILPTTEAKADVAASLNRLAA